MSEQLAQQKPATLGAPSKKRGFLEDDSLVMRFTVARMLQSGSPEVKDKLTGAEEGVLWDPISNSPLPKKFFPVMFRLSAVWWRDRKEGGGIIKVENPPFSPATLRDLEWRRTEDGMNIPPVAKLHIASVNIFAGMQGPVMLSWAGTARAQGEKFYSTAKLREGDAWFTEYEWYAHGRKNVKGDWVEIAVRPVGNTTPEQRELGEKLYNSLAGVKVEMSYDDPSGDDVGATVVAARSTSREPGQDEDLPDFLK